MCVLTDGQFQYRRGQRRRVGASFSRGQDRLDEPLSRTTGRRGGERRSGAHHGWPTDGHRVTLPAPRPNHPQVRGRDLRSVGLVVRCALDQKSMSVANERGSATGPAPTLRRCSASPRAMSSGEQLAVVPALGEGSDDPCVLGFWMATVPLESRSSSLVLQDRQR